MTQITMTEIGNNTATRQEIFDQVAVHLLKQGATSLGEGGGCAYRGENGLKCAVGCLMTDEQYDAVYYDFEDKTASALPGLDAAAGEFLEDLQRIHDTTDPILWRSALIRFADEHRLNLDALKEVE